MRWRLDFTPRKRSFLTTVVLLSPEVLGTRYIIRALHADEEANKAHENMGFHQGWGQSTDQLDRDQQRAHQTSQPEPVRSGCAS